MSERFEGTVYADSRAEGIEKFTAEAARYFSCKPENLIVHVRWANPDVTLAKKTLGYSMMCEAVKK